MKIIFSFLPFFLSFFLGYLLVKRITRKDAPHDPFLLFFLGGGLGLGLSAAITFSSFIILGQYSRFFIIGCHLLILFRLSYDHSQFTRLSNQPFFNIENLSRVQVGFFLLLPLLLVPSAIQCSFVPFGGWDAWSVWNFKAKFLFESATHWQGIFDPLMWRSSPHYPLLLPLIIVWGWTFVGEPLVFIPVLTALLYVFLLSGLLFFFLEKQMKRPVAILAPMILLTSPFYTKLNASQYADIVLAYYLLAAIGCYQLTLIRGENSTASLCGVYVGLLCFSKSEGILAAVILGALIYFFFLTQKRVHRWGPPRSALKYFLVALILAMLPTLILQSCYSPGNLTFTNGLTSPENPTTLFRFKMIMAFFLVELVSDKWNGLWILLLLSLFFTQGKCFQKSTAILPLFLSLYLLGVMSFYMINTYFEIKWWLQVSLNRILFSLLPLLTFWLFLSLWPRQETPE
jgi:hypothetical protein